MTGRSQGGRIIRSELGRLAGVGIHDGFGIGDVANIEGMAEFVGQGVDKFGLGIDEVNFDDLPAAVVNPLFRLLGQKAVEGIYGSVEVLNVGIEIGGGLIETGGFGLELTALGFQVPALILNLFIYMGRGSAAGIPVSDLGV